MPPRGPPPILPILPRLGMLREAPPPKEGDEARLALDDTEGLEGV